MYALSNVPYMNPISSKIIQIILLLILPGFTFMKRKYTILSNSKQLVHLLQLGLSIVSILDILISLIIPKKYPQPIIASYLKIPILIFLTKSIRENFKKLCYVIYDSIQMLAYIALYIAFYSFLG